MSHTSRPGLYIMVFCILLNTCDSAEILKAETAEREPVPLEERIHLPTKCKEFYNDGTDRWIECMGVGYK